MSLRSFISALRAGWFIVGICLLVGAGGALAASLAQTPLYESRTRLFVASTESATTAEAFQGSQLSQQRVASYAQLLNGESLASRVVDRLELSMTPGQVSSEISATPVAGTVLIDVVVADSSPVRARDIARAIGDEFSSMVAELETPAGGGISAVKVSAVEEPRVAGTPSSPQNARNVLSGAAVGLLLGVCGAVGRQRLDRSVHGVEEAAGLAGAPVIGVIVRDDALRQRHVVDRNSARPIAEGFRQLRTNLQFLNVDEPPKVIMVSSAVPSEGKTTVAVNLALTLAEAGRSVVLVEGDLRRPRVTRYLGMVGGAGLTNILAGRAELGDVLQSYGDGMLQVIAAGPTPPNPSELLASTHMFKLVDELRGAYDFVLIDAPPLLPVADASGLAVTVDGVLLSVRYGVTHKDQLQQARATLDRVGARTLGVILNIVPPKAEVSSAFGYGYGYAYDADRGPASSV